jgi:H+/Cl- antiporter ClcA
MIWKPTTKLGVGALICAILAVLSYGAIMVSMAGFGGVETRVVRILPGVLYILCGITGGVFAVLAIWKRHERSLLVYLALVPAALATFLVLGEVLYLIVFVLTGRQLH